jgi:hypothetical protein
MSKFTDVNNDNDAEYPEIETLEEDQLSRLDSFFGDLPGEYRIVLTREEPREYKGFLDEFIIDDLDNPLSIRSLIRQWGGKVLKILVRAPDGKFVRRFLVPLRSYPPLVNGIPLQPGGIISPQNQIPQQDSHDYLETLKVMQSAMKDIYQQQQSTPTENKSSEMMMQMILPFITAMAQNMARQQPTNQPSMADMMGMMVKMREFIGSDGKVGDSDDQVLPGLLRIGEALVTNRTATPSPRSLLKPPRISSIPVPPKPTQPPQSTTPPQISSQVPEMIETAKIPEMLCNLPTDVQKHLLLEILGQLPENRREALADAMLSALGIEVDEDEQHSDSKSNASDTPPSPRK